MSICWKPAAEFCACYVGAVAAGPQMHSAPTTVEGVRAQVDGVRARMAVAATRAGRDPETVPLLPVSKSVETQRLRLAIATGCTDLGENKVQESLGKSRELADIAGLRWHVMGHPQSNKARYVAEFAHEFPAVDRLSLARTLNNRLEIAGRTQHALVRACFQSLHRLTNQLAQEAPCGVVLGELSMGMSGDFERAVEEGSSVVRVGQAIFGARTLPDIWYWPTPKK